MIAALAILTVVQAVPAGRLAHVEIWFDARATVADFQGRTVVANGQVTAAPAPGEARGWVEVRWTDIDTKNGTRNRHMLKTVEADRFPTIRFELTRVSAAADTITGSLTLHGVTQQVVWPVSVHVGTDSITTAADFPVDMRDFGIKPPVRFVIARMGAVVTVHVRLGFVKD